MILPIPIEHQEKILVKPGQDVDFATPLYQTSVATQATISVAKQLEVSAKHIFRYMTRYVGDTLEKGETVAQKKGLFSTMKVKSPHKGVLQEINHAEGTVILSISEELETINYCYFVGVIDKVGHKELYLKVNASKQYDLKEMQGSTGGKLAYLHDEQEESSISYDNSFVVKEKFLPYEGAKYDALGAHGFVSLHTLKEETQLNYAIIKKIDDWNDLLKQRFPYCILDPVHSKIIAYR